MTDHEPSRMAHFRLPVSEYERFTLAAIRRRDTRSNLLRRAVREIIGQPADLIERELIGLDEAVYQLRAVGRNLNQITRAVHSGQLKEGQVDLVVLSALTQSVDHLAAQFLAVIEKSRLRRVFR